MSKDLTKLESRLDDLEGDMVILASGLEALAITFKRRRGEKHGVGIKEEIFNCLLAWGKSTGTKLGEFEQTSNKANNNSTQFNRAYQILKDNNATISNRFYDAGFRYAYWIYQEKNPGVIYRQLMRTQSVKPRKEEPQKPQKPEAEKNIQRVRMLFLKGLEDLLSFEETADNILIKPRGFLGSENFAKVAAIVRDAGGEYISAGKDSHFTIPIKA